MLKGLVLKDLYAVRFQIICSVLIMLLPVTIMMFMSLGMVSAESNTANDMGFTLYLMIDYVIIMFISSFALGTVGADKKSGWQKYQGTMPVNGRQVMLSKQISCYIVIGIAVAISLINDAFGIIYGSNPELLITAPICMGLLQSVIVNISLVLSIKHDSQMLDFVYIITEVVITLLVLALSVLIMGLGDFSVPIRIAAYGVLPAAAVLAAVIALRAGAAAYEKKI